MTEHKLTLELFLDRQHIRGRITDDSGSAREFSGWIGLAGAIEERLHGPEGEPSPLPLHDPAGAP